MAEDFHVAAQVEFEEILPYEDFAVRIPQHYLYLLPAILEMLMQQPGLVRWEQPLSQVKKLQPLR